MSNSSERDPNYLDLMYKVQQRERQKRQLTNLPHVTDFELKTKLEQLNTLIQKNPDNASELLDFCIKYFDTYWLEKVTNTIKEDK